MRPPPVLEDGAPQEPRDALPACSKQAGPQGLNLGELGSGWGLGSSLEPLPVVMHPRPGLRFSSSPEMLLQERARLTPPVPVYLQVSAAVFPN